MRIVEEDLVDWEPLRIRFIPKSQFHDPHRFAMELENWCQTNAGQTRSDCDIRYWKIIQTTPPLIEAICEHLTKKALRRLAQHLSKRCPELDHLVIGDHLHGQSAGLSFDWVHLPPAEVNLLGSDHLVTAVAIAYTPVTLGQFNEFTKLVGYTPVPDLLEYPGYLIRNFQANYGNSQKLPLFGLTYDDAAAYCEWAGLRLPFEPELHHFFASLARQRRKFNWSGDCWTASSPAPDQFVVRNGPYDVNSLTEPLQHFRKELHRHHYEYPEAPCFRVARSARQPRRAKFDP
jgi:Sulfatase-modifying factor enzyme 1